MDEQARRQALRKLLGDARAAVDPRTHGLTVPTARGRRAPGKRLSQAQAAQLIPIARTKYEALEAGRWRPPAHVLEAVARLYRLSEDQWSWLWQLTWAQDPPCVLHEQTRLEIPAAWARRVHRFADPAYVVDYRGTVRAANTAWVSMFPAGEAPANPWEWMLLADTARRHVLIDWEVAWAPFVCPQIHWSRSKFPDDPVLAAMEKRILADPVVRPIYEAFGCGAAHPDGTVRPFRHAELGPGWVEIQAAALKGSPYSQLTLLEFHPGPEAPTPCAPLSPEDA